MSFETVFGALALITSLIGLLPQSYKAFKTRSTTDVSMGMLINYLTCSTAWILYAICINSGFVLWSNVFCIFSCAALIWQKRHYDNLHRSR